ncbi:MAG: fucose isomerase [Candidatus Limiplasma sp.]|nr:fucose isomerase [Candidatus Limiplasma sp.]
MANIPVIKLGVVAVSRDCFPIQLSRTRRSALVNAYQKKYGQIVEVQTVIESETHVAAALKELADQNVNAMLVYLGNFGPEGPETILAQQFNGPVMFAAAAEETRETVKSDRGDAYCGMLNASYNIGLRGLKNVYIPEFPVGTAEEIADMLHDFCAISRIVLGVRNLKVMTFGPRPYDFLACNAPIKPLYDLGVLNVQENSELDLFAAFKAHADDKRIPDVIKDMAAELGEGNKMPGILPRLAQYEVTLLDWVEQNMGAAKYAFMANKCWPAFQTEFGFVPCYVNSRFASRLMPISCEVDIYGGLSEYMIACAMEDAPTILDINNTVPADLYNEAVKGKYHYTLNDTFMGFHCGNTPICHLTKGEMKYQLIMKRALEPDTEPNITRGTLEGDLTPGEITFFRLQGAADATLHSYIAQGEILPVATGSFGGIGIFAIPEMARFYRHVLVQKRYPHHGAVAFGKVGTVLFEALKLLGVEDIDYNHPAGVLYPKENPFA